MCGLETWIKFENPTGMRTSGWKVSLSAPPRGRLVNRDSASAFQHHVSMRYNSGKMNHWWKAHTHTHSLNPLLTPFGSRHACKVLKSKSGLQSDWSHRPQKWGLHGESNKYWLLRHWQETCCCFSILSQVFIVFPPLLGTHWNSLVSLRFPSRVSMRQRFTFDRFLCHLISLKYH